MNEVLVLGNGISRLLHGEFISRWTGELWACNRAYLEEDIAPKITLLSGHTDVLAEAEDYRDQHGLHFDILHGLHGQRGGGRSTSCPSEFRKDSGTTLISQAHEEGFDTIRVCGFDLGGPDIWSPELEFQRKHVWIRRWRALIEHYGAERIEFVGFDHLPYLRSRLSDEIYMARYQRRLPHIPDPDYIALHRMIYGGGGHLRGGRIMKVEFISGPKIGFRSDMSESVAMKYVAKGKVKIIGVADSKLLKDTGEDEVGASTNVTERMRLETLRTIAELREREGRRIEGWEDMKRTELIAALKGEAADKEPQG